MTDRIAQQEIAGLREGLLRAEQNERERCARLVRQMMDEKPWVDQPWARMAISIAANAIKRGRHLTDQEKAENLAKAMEEEGDPDGVACAAKIRATCGIITG